MAWQAFVIVGVLVAYLVFGIVSYWRGRPMRSCCMRGEQDSGVRSNRQG